MSIGPRYRLSRSRKPADREIDPGASSRLVHTQFPLDLFQLVYDDCRESDVASALSGLGDMAYVSDYLRAACLVFHGLLAGPSRQRVLAFANLPESKFSETLSHLVFRFAEPKTPEHADLYRQGEGVSPVPEGEAPLDDATPWNQV